jgi:predicted dehydrogenase
MHRKLKMGMIGGGRDSFIGAVHRMAAALDSECELACGVFGSTPERSSREGEALYLPPGRVYGSFEEMVEAEQRLPDGERMDFVSIVVPNHLHFGFAKLALENGLPVVCDKPMTLDLDQARRLATAVSETGLLFALTHNYTGYPMVKEVRNIVRGGQLGKIRKVVVEYLQGGMATRVEAAGNRRALWRTDPARSGATCCMADIGTHAENLAEYITGLKIVELCADLTTFVEGRRLDDDGGVLLRFENGARGILHASKVAAGEANALHIRVYGELGGVEWDQQRPGYLRVKWPGRPAETCTAGAAYLSTSAKKSARLPAGHPEGFIEAFANIYRSFLMALRARLEGRDPDPDNLDFPTARDGVRGMAFIEAVVESARSDRKWTKLASQ